MDTDITYLLKIEDETIPVVGSLTLGRHIDNEVIVAGEDVLDFHLRIELTDRGPQVVPLGDATFALNGREVEGHWGLIAGDVIGVGALAIHIGVEREEVDPVRAWVLVDEDTDRLHDIPADLLIGRHPECGLQIDSEHVSRRHARMVTVAGGLWLQDLGSANGTLVNGRLVAGGCRLFHGDEVRFDEAGFRVRGIGDDLTAIRSFREEDLKPIQTPFETSNEGAGGQMRSLTPVIESSLHRHAKGPRSVSVSAAAGGRPATSQPGNGHKPFSSTPWLESLSAELHGRRFQLGFGRSRLGSAAHCELRLESDQLADVHAEFVVRPGMTTLVATGGVTATTLNGEPAVVADLQAGDIVRFGELEFRYHPAPPQPNAGRAGWRRGLLAAAAVVIVITLAIWLSA